MAQQLSIGAIEAIMTGRPFDKPVLQVFGYKKIGGGGGAQGSDRYRLLVSDGKHSHSSAMLATQLNGKIESGELENNAIIRLDKYICNPIQGDRRVMILLELTVLTRGSLVSHKIGNAVAWKAGGQQDDAPSNPTPMDHNGMNGNNRPAPVRNAPTGPSFYPSRNAPPLSGPAASLPTPQASAANTGTPSRINSIASLTPYQNRWMIRARVLSKTPIRTWSNSRGEGKLFSFNLVDESGEIRVTAFKEEVDKFYDMLEVTKIYYVSKASIKTANKQFSSVQNDYEMTFNRETQVTPCDDEVELPKLSFNFVPIKQLEQNDPNSLVDVLAIVRSFADLSTVTSKQQQREIKKRDINLVDESMVQIRFTIWGDEAEHFSPVGHPVIAVKGARLSEWGGRSLSMISSAQMLLDPDLPEAHRLRGWYDRNGQSADFNEFQSDGISGAGAAGSGVKWRTFAEAKDECQNLQDKADYYTTKGTIVFLKRENCMYQACSSENCNKKVIDQGNGMYRCEKCNREYPDFKWRMILQLNLADYTDNQWVTCFQDTAEAILGRNVNDIAALKEQDENAFERVFQNANFRSFNFRLRSKMEQYNDESRLKTICVQASPIDVREYCHRLITEIEQMAAS